MDPSICPHKAINNSKADPRADNRAPGHTLK